MTNVNVSSVRQAVPSGALPFFQSIVALGNVPADKPNLSFEALGRLDLDGKILFPDQFLPCLEGTPSLEQFDRAILSKSIAKMRQWQHTLGIDVHMHVNASQDTLRNRNFATNVEILLGCNQVAASQLSIEVVESCHEFWQDSSILRTLGRLSKLGVGLAIDDFPMWSNPLGLINWLKVSREYLVNITYLKIDRSVISKVCAHEVQAVEAFQSYQRVAKELGIQVIAEGVENTADVVTMHALGVDAVQGYALGRPVNAEMTETYLRKVYQTPLMVPLSHQVSEIQKSRDVFTSPK